MVAVLRDLLARRVPHYFGTYIAGGWVTIELLSWIVDRYVLSDHLVDFVGLLLLLFLPAVLILSYYHGSPGRDHSTRLERIALTVNLGLALFVLVLVFSNTDLGAATAEVTIQDESGKAVTVRIPKSEFRRRVALFPFLDGTPAGELGWIPLGLGAALNADLAQDPFVKASHPLAYTETNPPFARQLDLAAESRSEFMVSGTVSPLPAGLGATIRLFDVSSGKLIREWECGAPDLFGLADTISVQLRRDMGVPAGHLRTVRDLPASEVLTPSEAALRAYTEVVYARSFRDRVEKLEAAVAEDSTFARAYFDLYGARRGMGRRDEAVDALKMAMRHSYRMPEPDRNLLLVQYFWIAEQDARKALEAAEQWATLFPDEVRPLAWVGQLKEANGDLDGAIAAHEKILELDSLEIGSFAAIATLEESRGHFEAALGALERYTEREPDDASSYLSMARLQRRLGLHEAATESCEAARLIQPGNVNALLCLGSIELDLGHLEPARARYDQAMEFSQSPGARAAVHAALANLHLRMGQPHQALEERALEGAEIGDSGRLPTAETARRTALLPLLVEAGRADEAFDTLDVIRSRVEPGWSFLRWEAEIALFSALEDSIRLAEATDSLAGYESYAPVAIRPTLLQAQGQLLELGGKFSEAAARYRETLQLTSLDTGPMLDLARIYLAMGDPQGAREQYEAYLKMYPFAPQARVGLARVLISLGEPDEAVGHLDAALAVWAGAEPGYEPAVEARRLRAGLLGGSG